MADRGRIIDLFAGAGGWEEALARLGRRALGIELDALAATTARMAGHARLLADVAALDPRAFAPVVGVAGSPPCQAYSLSGSKLGRLDKPQVIACAHELAAGHDSRVQRLALCRDPRSLLTVEPLRWAFALKPRWIALEQVPAVLELWSEFAGLLSVHGYHVATGVLGAEQYGVAQSRRRAFLIASLDGPVELPAPTHRSYDPRRPDRVLDHERHLLPWISMGQALGCPGRDGVVYTNSQTNGGRKPRGLSRPLTRPARTLDTSSGSWTIHPLLEDGTEPHYDTRQGWGRPRSINKPAPTLGASTPAIWVSEPEAQLEPTGRYRRRRGTRVTVEQASVLQGFDAAYPWQGASRSARFRQIGNAVCPPLAHRVLAAAMRIEEG